MFSADYYSKFFLKFFVPNCFALCKDNEVESAILWILSNLWQVLILQDISEICKKAAEFTLHDKLIVVIRMHTLHLTQKKLNVDG